MLDFSHVDTYVFDLDNTLYPAECHLFSQIDRRMSEFIEQRLTLPSVEARKLQKDYYVKYGTTLSGLMIEHQVIPETFMDFVHDIDLTAIEPNKALHKAIMNLPGKKLIFTNGSVKHAENVAGKLGVLDLFDGIFDIQMADYTPKPHLQTYEKFLKYFDVSAPRAAMFEDLPENLRAAHALGKTTVLVQSDADWFKDEPADKRPAKIGENFDFVHHTTNDLTAFLSSLRTTPHI